MKKKSYKEKRLWKAGLLLMYISSVLFLALFFTKEIIENYIVLLFNLIAVVFLSGAIMCNFAIDDKNGN